MNDTFSKNQILNCAIENWNSDGYGVARINGKTVFIPGTIPGEEWQVRIVKNLTSYAFGKGEQCLKASPERVLPDCRIFPQCGGCTMRHMSYAKELEFKLQKVNDAFKHIGGLDLTASDIIGAPTVDQYRNKAIYAVSKDLRPGFYRTRSHDVLPIDSCHLQQNASDEVARVICNFCRSNGFESYDEVTRKGTIRHIFTRVSHTTGKMQVTIIAAKGFGDKTESLINAILDACPEVESIVLNVNKTTGNTVLSGSFYTLWGTDTITDTLCNSQFRLSPASFFQVNPVQAEKLYGIAIDFAAPNQRDTVLDLYCGAGTITLCLAQKARFVFGAEIVPEAIQNAVENAERNHVNNVEFLCADAGAAAIELKNRGVSVDSVVVDPPRKGLTNELISTVCAMNPVRVVYVSCNVSTQARDVKAFSELGYLPRKAIAVDMFPRTSHVETVVLLSRADCIKEDSITLCDESIEP